MLYQEYRLVLFNQHRSSRAQTRSMHCKLQAMCLRQGISRLLRPSFSFSVVVTSASRPIATTAACDIYSPRLSFPSPFFPPWGSRWEWTRAHRCRAGNQLDERLFGTPARPPQPHVVRVGFSGVPHIPLTVRRNVDAIRSVRVAVARYPHRNLKEVICQPS